MVIDTIKGGVDEQDASVGQLNGCAFAGAFSIITMVFDPSCLQRLHRKGKAIQRMMAEDVADLAISRQFNLSKIDAGHSFVCSVV